MLGANVPAPLVSTTTRAPRVGELNGVNYHFVAKEEFEVMAHSGLMLEHVEFGGHRYGATNASVKEAMSKHSLVTIVCEPVGARQIREHCQRHNIPLLAVFVRCPLELQVERMVERLGQQISQSHFVHFDKIVADFKTRLLAAIGEEQHWLSQAHFDLVVASFDDDTIEHAIRTVVSEASKRG
jgi:guanylate kinase